MTRTAQIAPARDAEDYAAAGVLIEEYARSLPVGLEFQDFDAEITALRTMYGPPGGTLLLARRGDELLGCVAVRRMTEGICEMKRLYVRSGGRGTGLGRALAEAAIDAARRLGYRTMRLDTLASMTAAQTLYRALGFREIDPYYDNPHPAVFMERTLG